MHRPGNPSLSLREGLGKASVNVNTGRRRQRRCRRFRGALRVKCSGNRGQSTGERSRAGPLRLTTDCCSLFRPRI
eukprot:2893289-Prymnesium_polylepis.1